MAIPSISAVTASRTPVALLGDTAHAHPVNLEQRLLESYATAGQEIHRADASIREIISSPDITNPEVLARLQNEMAQYNVDVTLINALVRKAVGTVETLLRAS